MVRSLDQWLCSTEVEIHTVGDNKVFSLGRLAVVTKNLLCIYQQTQLLSVICHPSQRFLHASLLPFPLSVT